MESLWVENVSKGFKGLEVLSQVDIKVQAGERHVIIGPNGAGKTTLFNVVSGRFAPDSGRIHLFGQDVTGVPPHRRCHLGLGRTFQITQIFGNLTLYENVLLAAQGTHPSRFDFWGSAWGKRDPVDRANDLLAEWDLEDKRATLAKNLSYGTQRRLELMMVLASGTKLLLLDEPTAGLSAAEMVTMVSMIKSLDSRMSFLIIEHNMDVAFELADRITVLHLGRLELSGLPEDIKKSARVKEIYLGQA